MNGRGHPGGLYIENGLLLAIGLRGSWGDLAREGAGVVESQNRLCLESDVCVENHWLHLRHLNCVLQSACIRLCRQRFENCV